MFGEELEPDRNKHPEQIVRILNIFIKRRVILNSDWKRKMILLSLHILFNRSVTIIIISNIYYLQILIDWLIRSDAELEILWNGIVSYAA